MAWGLKGLRILLSEILPIVLGEDDIIVAVIGAAGAGKTTFIDAVSNRKKIWANHSLKSESIRNIQATLVKHKGFPGRRIYLLDTPGFDDKPKPVEVLGMIHKWLSRRRGKPKAKQLSGLIYLQRITDTRMETSMLEALRDCHTLGGKNMTIDKILFATTMWGSNQLSNGPEERSELERENKIRSMVKEYIGRARVDRFRERTTEEAWRVLKSVLREVLEGQREDSGEQ
ncbi:hypothetical protein AN958_06243 [Leucoagaricus sp. SymC.cos]|nr:hypothetical protein AN958_06243 [Leucoagaricus sp. SymC.cos]